MKLFKVHLWNIDLKERDDQYTYIPAESEEDAETKALDNFYQECAEAEEVKEIDGYKVVFEKIN